MNYFKVGSIAIIITISTIIGLNGNFSTSKENKTRTIKFDNSLMNFSDKDMSSMSSLIVKGKVVDVKASQWNTVDGTEPNNMGFKDMIYHDVIINIEKVYKGTISDCSQVTVRVYGGEVANGKKIKRIIDDSSAEFAKNEDVLLFLANDDTPFNKSNQSDYYILLGSKQGKYNINGDKIKNINGERNIKELLDEVDKYKNDEPTIKKGNGNI